MCVCGLDAKVPDIHNNNTQTKKVNKSVENF